MAGFFDSLSGLGGLGTALGGLGSFVGSIFGNGRPSLSAQLDVNKKLAKYQHDLSMDAWREQNAYNDPAAQMERLKNAGLNPHSIAGSSSMAGNASGVPSAQVDTPDLSKFQRKIDFEALMTMGQSLQVMENSMAEIKNKNANTALLNTQEKVAQEDVLNRQVQREQINLDNAFKRLQMVQSAEMFKYDTAFKKAQTDKIIKEIDDIQLRIENYQHTIDNLLADTAEKKARTKKTEEDTKTSQYQNKYWYGEGIWPGSGFQQIASASLGRVFSHIGNDAGDYLISMYEHYKKHGTLKGYKYVSPEVQKTIEWARDFHKKHRDAFRRYHEYVPQIRLR